MARRVVYVWRTVPKGGVATPEEVSEASYGLLARIGPRIGQRQVLIKPNVTIETTRESGIVTDCAHADGIVRWLLDSGRSSRRIAIGEGGGAWMPNAFAVAGYTDLAEAYGIGLYSFNDLRLEYVEQKCPFIADRIAHIGRGQRIARRVLDPDTFVINAPKLKNHNAMAISICIKNLMGTQHPHDRSLCGISRAYAKVRRMDYERRFAHEMCNLYERVRPDYNVVDGVMARMGSGFHDGENYPLNLTVAGDDGFAVDFVCSYLMGYNPEHLLLFRVAARKGMAPGHIGDVEVRLVSVEGDREGGIDDLEALSSPGGFWVKYHREHSHRRPPCRLEEYYPGLYRRAVMERNSDLGKAA